MSRAADRRVVLGGEPRVDLLPGEYRAREQARALRRRLVLGLVGLAVVAAAGYAWAWLDARVAENELAQANARTTELLTEQSRYSAVVGIDAALASGAEALAHATSTDVPWRPVVDRIVAALPADVAVVSLTAIARLPWEPELVVTDPLPGTAVSTITIQVASAGVPDAAAFVRALAGIPGYLDGQPDSVVGDGAGYLTTITLHLDETVLRSAGETEGDG